jgi:hypothetical protein
MRSFSLLKPMGKKHHGRLEMLRAIEVWALGKLLQGLKG